MINLHLPKVTQAFINEPDALAQLAFECPETLLGCLCGSCLCGCWVGSLHGFWSCWFRGWFSRDGGAGNSEGHGDELAFSSKEDGIVFVTDAGFRNSGFEGSLEELWVEEDSTVWSLARGVLGAVGGPLIRFLFITDEADFIGSGEDVDSVALQLLKHREIVFSKGDSGRATSQVWNNLTPVWVIAIDCRRSESPWPGGKLDHGRFLFTSADFELPFIFKTFPLEKGRGGENEGLLELQTLE